MEQNNAYFLEKSGMLKLGLSGGYDRHQQVFRLKLWFIIAQKDLRKGLTRSCLPPAPPMTPLPYRFTSKSG
ncbi:hypothetical protein DMH88_02650 [Escherichia coli]|nr:hypothetical protein [Escherichia coli]